MMKTVTAQLSQIITNFAITQVDYLLETDHTDDQEVDVEIFLRDLRNLLIQKRKLTPSTIRNLFSSGYTMMLLEPDQFNFLELAYNDKEEFSVVVKDGEETLCILCQNEVTW